MSREPGSAAPTLGKTGGPKFEGSLVSRGQKRGVGPLEMELRHFCDLPWSCWESNTSPLEGQSVLLTVVPPLQP